jgi:subtilisin family serine protease
MPPKMERKNYTLLGVAILSFAVVLISTFLLLFLSKDSEFTTASPFFTSQYISEKSNDLATNIVSETDLPSGEDVNSAKQGDIVLDESRKVVVFEKDLTEEEKSSIEEEYSVEFTEEKGQSGIYTIITTEESNLEDLTEEDSIDSIETDVPVTISETVDWGITRIGADKVWEESTGNGFTVAIIDTGIQLDHPDLQGNIVSGYDFVNDRENATDDHGHGTHVAGIVAALQNQAGIVGSSHSAKLMPVKVLNSTGSGYVSDVAKGIYWATDNGARIINLSLGTTVDSSTLKGAIDYASRKGVLLAAAAGNESGSPCNYPAAYNEVVCVVATDNTNKLASFSNIGGELAAPGVSNYSTFLGSTYRYLSGTSMASPHVAGSLAIVGEACPTCSATELRQVLRDTAIDLGEEGYDIIFGYGLVDLVAAVDTFLPEEDIEEEEPVEEVPEENDEPTEEVPEEEESEEEETGQEERETRRVVPEKGDFDRQQPVITKPERDKNERISMTTAEDIKIEFELEPTIANSGFEKTILYLNNEEVYTTTKESDEYILEYDEFEGVQQFIRVTSFFEDGTQAHDQLIIDRINLLRERSSDNIIQRGRRVLGISSGFSLLDIFKF